MSETREKIPIELRDCLTRYLEWCLLHFSLDYQTEQQIISELNRREQELAAVTPPPPPTFSCGHAGNN